MTEIKVDQIWHATDNPYAIQGLSWSTPWEIDKTYRIKNVTHIPNDDRMISFSSEESTNKKEDIWEISSSNFLLGFKLVS